MYAAPRSASAHEQLLTAADQDEHEHERAQRADACDRGDDSRLVRDRVRKHARIREGGQCAERYTRTCLAKRLNAATSSNGTWNGTSSRHSMTGTPACW